VLGQWVQAEGAIYDMWDENRHVVSSLPPMQRFPAIGIDYGTASVFAALALDLGDDGGLYLTKEFRYDAKAAGRQLTDVEYLERINGWRGPLRPDLMVVDPSASSFITEMISSGMATTKGDNSVLDGIRLMSSSWPRTGPRCTSRTVDVSIHDMQTS
jgi:hypothetical protein